MIPSRPVSITVFVRLKLRMLGHGLRGERRRVIAFAISLGVGLWLAVTGFVLFGVSGAVRHDIGYLMAAFGGAALVLGWLLLPLLFFGVDETLDPARFALLPLPRRTLAAGMLAGAMVGVPGLATALAMLGLAVAGGLRAGPAGAGVALLGGGLNLLLCIVLSRAVTSGFAAMLRSRRVRDLAGVVIALLAASMGPLQLVISSMVGHASLAPVLRVARVLGWTPLAAGFVAPYDLADGRPLAVPVRLGIVAVTVALLAWWWAVTLESAMLGAAGAPAGSRPVRGGVVRALLPAVLRPVRAGQFAAIAARELRYWSRDPRRRSSLISIIVGGAVVPVALRLTPGHSPGVPLPLAVAFTSVAGAAILANQFGFDGTAYAAHLLAAVPGRVELRGRAAALSVIMVPVLLVIVVAVAVFGDEDGQLVPTLGTAAAMYGASIAVASVLSVLIAYPVPDTRNAFASAGGSASAKGLLAFVGMVVAVVSASPVLAAALVLPGALAWVVLAAGLAWGLGLVLVTTRLVGDELDRRGPELLAAVTLRV
ncbi:transporter [Rugosimonospora acidiphila]|uniref:Transporter n=1 Tax=Rugosimonospora acidiphila TaxID=556531 RepID=A0ABP9RZ11_9ACTN